MTEACWLAQQNITKEKVTQREAKIPYETNKAREREQRNKMKSYNSVVV
jgi:predicted RNA polymerase sigma factor